MDSEGATETIFATASVPVVRIDAKGIKNRRRELFERKISRDGNAPPTTGAQRRLSGIDSQSLTSPGMLESLPPCELSTFWMQEAFI